MKAVFECGDGRRGRSMQRETRWTGQKSSDRSALQRQVRALRTGQGMRSSWATMRRRHTCSRNSLGTPCAHAAKERLQAQMAMCGIRLADPCELMSLSVEATNRFRWKRLIGSGRQSADGHPHPCNANRRPSLRTLPPPKPSCR
eukprot:6212944-Pleurochrysis_carterae.AAC.1